MLPAYTGRPLQLGHESSATSSHGWLLSSPVRRSGLRVVGSRQPKKPTRRGGRGRRPEHRQAGLGGRACLSLSTAGSTAPLVVVAAGPERADLPHGRSPLPEIPRRTSLTPSLGPTTPELGQWAGHRCEHPSTRSCTTTTKGPLHLCRKLWLTPLAKRLLRSAIMHIGTSVRGRPAAFRLPARPPEISNPPSDYRPALAPSGSARRGRRSAHPGTGTEFSGGVHFRALSALRPKRGHCTFVGSFG